MSLPSPVQDVTSRFLAEVDQRLPGRVTSLFLHGSICWGEFFPGSDIDFVALWDELPTGAELDLLRVAHEHTDAAHPKHAFDGAHCTARDLAGPPAAVEPRPGSFQGAFDAEGGAGISLVTWHELAERAVTIRGELPPVHTDPTALAEFTRDNLDTYWRGAVARIEAAGIDTFGRNDTAVEWVGLGPARLHHLLTRGHLTSKSGGGRYLCELDPRWARIGREALRLREHPDRPSLYDDPVERGQDAYDQLVRIVEDGSALGPAEARPGDARTP